MNNQLKPRKIKTLIFSALFFLSPYPLAFGLFFRGQKTPKSKAKNSKKEEEKPRKTPLSEVCNFGPPAYEFFTTNEAAGNSYFIYRSNFVVTKDTPRALFPPMENKINVSGNSGNLQPVEEVKF